MKRRAWLTGGVAALAAVGGVWWQTRASVPQALEGDAAFWTMSFERPEGGQLTIDAFRGRPVLLNFWATWCPPCVKEMPMLSDFQRAQEAAQWQVIGIAVDSPTPVRQFLNRTPMSFPIGLAGMDGIELSRSLGNQGGQMPFTVVFDRSGRAVERKLGALQPEDLARWAAKWSATA